MVGLSFTAFRCVSSTLSKQHGCTAWTKVANRSPTAKKRTVRTVTHGHRSCLQECTDTSNHHVNLPRCNIKEMAAVGVSKKENLFTLTDDGIADSKIFEAVSRENTSFDYNHWSPQKLAVMQAFRSKARKPVGKAFPLLESRASANLKAIGVITYAMSMYENAGKTLSTAIYYGSDARFPLGCSKFETIFIVRIISKSVQIVQMSGKELSAYDKKWLVYKWIRNLLPKRSFSWGYLLILTIYIHFKRYIQVPF